MKNKVSIPDSILFGLIFTMISFFFLPPWSSPEENFLKELALRWILCSSFTAISWSIFTGEIWDT